VGLPLFLKHPQALRNCSRPVCFRQYADRPDPPPDTLRPRPPELDLKTQDSEAMNEIQKEQETKAKQQKAGKQVKADILEETKVLSKAEQRKVNWGILKTLVKYIWPKVLLLGFRGSWGGQHWIPNTSGYSLVITCWRKSKYSVKQALTKRS
jgi:hypothetical protein